MSTLKALSLRERRIVYYSTLLSYMVNVTDSSTGMSFNISTRKFRELFVPESDLHMPPAARAILDAAPSWDEWRDRRKA